MFRQSMNNMRIMHIRHCLLYEFQQYHTIEIAIRNIRDKFVNDSIISYSLAKFWYI
jgi:hypothetical protein